MITKTKSDIGVSLVLQGGAWSDAFHSDILTMGTSMLPFFKPGEKIALQPINRSSIRIGDALAFYGESGFLVVHRVLRICQRGDKLYFVTKGDNHFLRDPIVPEDKIVGIAVRTGKRDLRKLRSRWLGRLIAYASLAEDIAYRRLSKSRLNKWRHQWESWGWCPKIQMRNWIHAIANPLGLIAQISRTTQTDFKAGDSS